MKFVFKMFKNLLNECNQDEEFRNDKILKWPKIINMFHFLLLTHRM